MIHIGQLIKEKVEEDGRTIAAIADACGIKRPNFTHIFTRESIDTDLLLKISRGLNYDFFRHYSAQILGARTSAPLPPPDALDKLQASFEQFFETAQKLLTPEPNKRAE